MNRASSVFIAAVLLSAAASALSAQQMAPPENPTVSMDRARAIALAQVPNRRYARYANVSRM